MTATPPLSPPSSPAAAASTIPPPPVVLATPKAAAEIFSQRADCNPTLPPLSNIHETTTASDDDGDALGQALLEKILQLYDQQLSSASNNAPTPQAVPFASPEGLPLIFDAIQLLQNSPHAQDKKNLTDTCLDVSKKVNMMLKDITLFFKNLLAQEVSALPAWMAAECQSEAFKNLRPFFTSSLFQNSLSKLTALKPLLSDELIGAWSFDYPACVARLQEAGLAVYNEQAEPAGGFFDSLKSFAGGSLHAMQNAGMEAFKAPMRQGLRTALDSMCRFDQEVIRRADNPAAIIAFIEKMKHQPEEYTAAFVLRPVFFLTLITMQFMQVKLDQRDVNGWQELDLRCVCILYNSPELKSYLNEPPPAEVQSQIAMMKAQYGNLLGDTKEEMSLRLQMDIETLQKLLKQLEKEPVNHSEIEVFLKMSTGIFTNAKVFEAQQWLDKEFFESTSYDTHYRLFKLCCSKLIELKFQFPSLSFEEMHSEMNIPPPVTPPAAAKSVKGPAEQLKEDSAFLVELLKQEDTQVEDWLTKHDVAAVLLRGKQFREDIKTLLTQVDRETVRNWREQYMACVEKLGNDKLKLYGW
jgi:hypothetical protein